MKKAIGEQQDISYQVDCPHCGETSYSDMGDWSDLEHGDGTPHGVLECSDCGEEFEMSIK